MFKKSEEVAKIEETISLAEKEEKELREKAPSQLRDEIMNDEKYGPRGVLYSLRDDCFEIMANKYTY